ncbi:MAG TPA: MaoC family dehydratase [Dehalococcoidales bacterium]
MSETSGWKALPIGLEMGPLELVLDNNTVKQRVELVQWENHEPVDKLGVTPPGITIANHALMKFTAWPDLRASIWAKSEHEFLKPMKVGSRIYIRGKIIDKYVKRNRNYVVAEYETVNEDGEVLMRSRETAVYVE